MANISVRCYIAYGDGYWRAFDCDTGEQIVAAKSYTSLRVQCLAMGYVVAWVRRHSTPYL